MSDEPNTHHCDCGVIFSDFSNNSECSKCTRERHREEVEFQEQEELDYQQFLAEYNLELLDSED